MGDRGPIARWDDLIADVVAYPELERRAVTHFGLNRGWTGVYGAGIRLVRPATAPDPPVPLWLREVQVCVSQPAAVTPADCTGPPRASCSTHTIADALERERLVRLPPLVRGAFV